MLQSTFSTSNQSLLKNNLQPPYKLLFSSFLFFVQIQSLIWTPYTEIFFQLSLVIQLLQNTSLQMADGLQIQTVFSFSIIESIYQLLVISAYILQYNHDHILVRHYSQNKILKLVCHGYSWSSLHADVQQFCKFYITCMQSKPQHHKPYRSLKQLPIPKQPWNSISIDFIKKLLLFSEFDTILVIVNWLTKQMIFISVHNIIMSADLAYLFVLHMFSKYGVFSHVISNILTEAWSLC